jgi:hypothetical protein
MNMASKLKIEHALADLEAGKFSLRMVDAIKDHIDKLENELKVVSALHASAINDLRQQEFANWRLEGELKKLNAKIHALLKANMLTEKALRAMTPVVHKMGEHLQFARKSVSNSLEKATAYLSTVRVEGELKRLNAKIHALLKANMPTEKAFREMTPIALKMGEYLRVARASVTASLEKVTTHLSTLHKPAA